MPALRAKIAELEAVAEKQSKQATEIAELRSLLGMKKCEKIHLTQEMWADGGYTWTKVTFANTYKDPRVTFSIEHNNLVVLFLNHAICAKADVILKSHKVQKLARNCAKAVAALQVQS